MNANKKTSRGFSLIEALVVVGVTVILSTILFTYTRSSEGQVVFFKEQSLLVSSILRTKAFAIETFQPELQPPGSGLPLPARVCAWGISIDKGAGKYVIFRDDPDQVTSLCPGDYQRDLGGGEDFETFALDSRVIISCLATILNPNDICTIGTPHQTLDVIFTPPDPVVNFNPGDSDSKAVVELTLMNGTRSTTIQVGKGGQVTVQ